ncbi:hypothetical protein H311_01722, partial [Anncaliia algerae PRA109]
MEFQSYNWYEENEDDDVGEFTPRESEKNIAELLFDKLYDLSFYIFVMALGLYFIRWIFNFDSFSFGEVSLNSILIFCITFFGSFVVISVVINIFVIIAKQFVSPITKRYLEIGNKGYRLSMWFAFNLYAIDYVDYKFVLKHYLVVKNL